MIPSSISCIVWSGVPGHTLQTVWISKAQRIPLYIAVPIPPPIQPNRVRLRVPPRRRIVVPVQVVAQPRFLVPLLPRVAQVEADGLCIAFDAADIRLRVPLRTLGRRCFSKPGDQPLPCHLPLLVGQAPGRVQVVTVDGIQPSVDLRCDGHGAACRGQVDYFRAVQLARWGRAVRASAVAVLAQHGTAYAIFGVEGLLGDRCVV